MDDAGIEGKKKDFDRDSQMHSRLLIRAGITFLALTVLCVMNVGFILADDQLPPSMTTGYQNGTITAINENTLDIDGRTYGLIQEVVILNQTGRVMEPRDLVVTAEVKFHVTKEDNNKIDKMIVTFPR